MLRHFWLVSLLAIFGALRVSPASGEQLILAEKGQTEYRIVVADDASPSTKHAGEELRLFFEQMTGAKLAFVSDREPVGPREIVLGDNAHRKELDPNAELSGLGDEGYVIETVGPHLVIAGGSLRGNLYGVYGLLEDHLGCRWFTPEVSRIPKREKLSIESIRDRQVPSLEYREPFVIDCFDGDWCARNRMNSTAARLEAKHGGKIALAKGGLAHTFSAMISPNEFYAIHPEYFSLVGGKRQNGYAQLCCTNEEVIHLCTQRAIQWLREQPEAQTVSVSQNDCFKFCECEKCQSLAVAEESQMAPVLQMVNRVAEAVEKELPGKSVQTIAYQWTRKPPKNLRPRQNVIIMLCSIECCFSHPLATCDSEANKKFREDTEAWSKTGAKLWVWDYTTDFSSYLLPFPNQRVLGPNIRFYIEHGVKGIFEEDNFECPHGEMSELDGYLMAKLLWNPKCDENAVAGEFLDAYYGPAAEPVAKYLDLIHDYPEKKNIHVGIYIHANSPHLTDEMLLSANDLWQEAEQRAEGDTAVLRRVKISRMSVDYAIMERVRLVSSGNADLKRIAVTRFEPFMSELKSNGVTRLSEGAPFNYEAYRKGLEEMLK
jgi:hypothetical protein